MAGKIKKIIDQIFEQRAGNNPTLISTTKTKLLLKGIDVGKYSLLSPDDAQVISKLTEIAAQLNINITNN